MITAATIMISSIAAIVGQVAKARTINVGGWNSGIICSMIVINPIKLIIPIQIGLVMIDPAIATRIGAMSSIAIFTVITIIRIVATIAILIGAVPSIPIFTIIAMIRIMVIIKIIAIRISVVPVRLALSLPFLANLFSVVRLRRPVAGLIRPRSSPFVFFGRFEQPNPQEIIAGAANGLG